MQVGRDEALDMFRVWRDDGALLRCDLSFGEFAASLRVRVRTLSAERVACASDDDLSEVVVPFVDGLSFGYGDPRDFPDEATEYERGLILFFPPRNADAGPDEIAFSELKR